MIKNNLDFKFKVSLLDLFYIKQVSYLKRYLQISIELFEIKS
jgi:hypothetical protein